MTFITLTTENIHWALNENLRMLAEEIKYKLPANGRARLLGNLDLAGHTITGIVANGPQSAYSIDGHIALKD